MWIHLCMQAFVVLGGSCVKSLGSSILIQNPQKRVETAAKIFHESMPNPSI